MALYRLTQRGHIGTEDFWDTTLHAEDTSGNAASILSVFATAVTNLWTNPGTPADSIAQYVSTDIGVDELTVDEIGDDNKNIAQARGTLAIPGTSVNASLPPGNSVAVSTRTATPTRAGRGRFYLPPFVVTTVSGFRLDTTVRNHVAAAGQIYVQTVADGVLTGVVIWGQRFGTHGRVVTSVDCGNVFDSQRRRRDLMVEARISLPIT